MNAVHAYLKTEGKIDYRECQVAYYTYCMIATPNKYNITVNVHIQSDSIKCKKTLNIDNNFDTEKEAIDYGITQGKNYIDKSYEAGKVSFLKTMPQANNPIVNKPLTTTKSQGNGQSKNNK